MFTLEPTHFKLLFILTSLGLVFNYTDKIKPLGYVIIALCILLGLQIIDRWYLNVEGFQIPSELFSENKYNALINPPSAKDFWINDDRNGGYFDMGNANTHRFITGDSRCLKETNENYTIEMWLKPQYFGNPYIMSVSDGVRRVIDSHEGEYEAESTNTKDIQYFTIKIDEFTIHIENDSLENHIPYEPDTWMQFVIVRGSEGQIGSNLGKIYKNGVYLRPTNYAQKLNTVKEGGWIFFQDPSKLGLSHNKYLSSNPQYNNRSNFAIFRLYNRSLTASEITTNFEAHGRRFGVTSGACSQYVKSGLICDLDAGNKSSYPGSGSVWYDISPPKTTLNSELSNPIIINATPDVKHNKELGNVLRQLKKQGMYVDSNIIYDLERPPKKQKLKPSKPIKHTSPYSMVKDDDGTLNLMVPKEMKGKEFNDLTVGDFMKLLVDNDAFASKNFKQKQIKHQDPYKSIVDEKQIVKKQCNKRLNMVELKEIPVLDINILNQNKKHIIQPKKIKLIQKQMKEQEIEKQEMEKQEIEEQEIEEQEMEEQEMEEQEMEEQEIKQIEKKVKKQIQEQEYYKRGWLDFEA